MLGKKGTVPEPVSYLKIEHELFDEIYGLEGHKKVEPIKTTEKLLLSINTSTTVGTVKKITGKKGIELSLNIPVVPFKGDHLGIARNINSHWRLIGWGEILGEAK